MRTNFLYQNPDHSYNRFCKFFSLRKQSRPGKLRFFLQTLPSFRPIQEDFAAFLRTMLNVYTFLMGDAREARLYAWQMRELRHALPDGDRRRLVPRGDAGNKETRPTRFKMSKQSVARRMPRILCRNPSSQRSFTLRCITNDQVRHRGTVSQTRLNMP